MLDKLNQYTLVVELIKRNARISLIIKETTVPKKLIKKTYRELIGHSASPGPIKESSRGLTEEHEALQGGGAICRDFQES